MQVALESFGCRELSKDVDALFAAELLLQATLHELVLQPEALVGIGDMRETRRRWGPANTLFSKATMSRSLARRGTAFDAAAGV